MEKKVLTEILRIKELMGGKNLLNEQVPPIVVRGLRALKDFFTNQSDDVVKKIIKIDDDAIIKKVKDGTLEFEETVKVIKNTGGTLKSLYNKVAKETFNQKNYGKFYNNFQKLKKTGNMDKIWSYNDVIDKNIDTVLSDLPEGYRTEVKIMLKNDLKLALESKTKTNPIVPNKTPKNPKVTKKAKVTTPTSEFSPDSAIKNLLNDTGEITEEKILAAANKDFENIFAKHKITIPLESIADFNETLISRLKRAIPNEFDKTFDNMMKTYKAIDNPVERKEFFTKIADDLNINLNAGLKEIESSTGIKFNSPNLFGKLNNFLTQNFFGKHLLGGKYLNTKPSGFLRAWLYMSGVASLLNFFDAMFTAMIPTKDDRSIPKMVGDDIKDLWDSILNGKSLSREYWQKFMWKHFAPFVNVIAYSAQSIWHFIEAGARISFDAPRDVTPTSDDDSNKQSTIEKGKDKLLEIFKSSLSKVEPKILDKYLNNITLNEKGDGLILTDNGTVYEIHKPLLGASAFIVDGEDKYMFTNEMFTK